MKSWKQQIISFPLVIAVLLSTTGIVVFDHHCQAAENSGEANCAKDCCKKPEADPNCCSTEFIYISADKDLLNHQFNVEIPNEGFQFIECFVTLLRQFTSTEILKPDYLNFKPPLFGLNICVLVQSFLL